MITGLIIGFLIGFLTTFGYLVFLKFVKRPMNKLINESFSNFLNFGIKNGIDVVDIQKKIYKKNKF
jgi:dimeric dUTPase (all-alpha-NTP-PPase superfamily)